MTVLRSVLDFRAYRVFLFVKFFILAGRAGMEQGNSYVSGPESAQSTHDYRLLDDNGCKFRYADFFGDIPMMPAPQLAILLSLGLCFSGSAAAHCDVSNGYLTDLRGHLVRTSSGDCVRTGYWTPAMATSACDPSLIAPVAADPAPVVQPVAAVTPAVITLQAEALFDFDSAVVRPDGLKVLDEQVVAKLRGTTSVEVVRVTGHSDRLGSAAYNYSLSEQRAVAVLAYLVQHGISGQRMETVGAGEHEPLAACTDVGGTERRTNKKLVDCLQPNRRVTVAIRVQKP